MMLRSPSSETITLDNAQQVTEIARFGSGVFTPAVAYNANTDQLVVGAAIVERENPGYAGTRGWFTDFTLNRDLVTLHDLVHTLTSGGHTHHYAVGIGDVTRELIEFASWTGVQRIAKRTYTEYLTLP